MVELNFNVEIDMYTLRKEDEEIVKNIADNIENIIRDAVENVYECCVSVEYENTQYK